jgi:HSP20 family protein
LRELEEMQQRTLALLQRAFGDGLAEGGAWAPPVDIEETEDAWLIEAEIPGAKRDDVDRVTLPTPIDRDSIDAILDAGVLTVRVPKPEGARRHRIEIGTPSG